jgi:hypothetical protein
MESDEPEGLKTLFDLGIFLYEMGEKVAFLFIDCGV